MQLSLEKWRVLEYCGRACMERPSSADCKPEIVPLAPTSAQSALLLLRSAACIWWQTNVYCVCDLFAAMACSCVLWCAGRLVTPMEKPKPAEVKVMQRAARKVEEDDRAARLAAKIASKGKGSASDREKDYQNARNRIFNLGANSSSDSASPTQGSPAPEAHTDVSQSDATLPDAALPHAPPIVPAVAAVAGGIGFAAGRGRGGPDGVSASCSSPLGAVVPGPVFSKPAGRGAAAAQQQAPPQGMHRKATLSNKQADLQDPDYDRSKFNRQNQQAQSLSPQLLQQQQHEMFFQQQQQQQQQYMQQQQQYQHMHQQQQQHMQDKAAGLNATLNAAAPDFSIHHGINLRISLWRLYLSVHFVSTHIHARVYTHKYTHTHVRARTHTYTHTHAHAHAHTHTHTHTHKHMMSAEATSKVKE